MKTSLTTVTGVLIAAVLGAGAGFASWQFFTHEDGPTPLFVELTPAKAPPPPPELIGAAAPDFVLPDLAGEQRTLADWSGKVVVLNFWATWCAPCREEMPMLVEIGDEYRGKGVEVVGVAVDDRDKIESRVRAGLFGMPSADHTLSQDREFDHITAPICQGTNS